MPPVEVVEALAALLEERISRPSPLVIDQLHDCVLDAEPMLTFRAMEELCSAVSAARQRERRKSFGEAEWVRYGYQFPEERHVARDTAVPLVRGGDYWVLACSRWWLPHTTRLVSYFACGYGAPADVWEAARDRLNVVYAGETGGLTDMQLYELGRLRWFGGNEAIIV